MDLIAEERGGFVVLQVQAPRVDAQNAAQLKGRLQELTAGDGARLVVDLSQVKFMDSSGLGALIVAYRRAAAGEGTLILAGLQPQVRSVLELTRLHKLFQIRDSVGAAAAGLGQSGERQAGG